MDLLAQVVAAFGIGLVPGSHTVERAAEVPHRLGVQLFPIGRPAAHTVSSRCDGNFITSAFEHTKLFFASLAPLRDNVFLMTRRLFLGTLAATAAHGATPK